MSDRYQAKIDADPVQNLALFLVWHVNGCEEKPFLIAVDQIGFAALKAEHLLVMVAANERNLLPAIERPDVRDAFLHVPRQNARIIRDRAMLSEFALHLAIELVAVGNLGVESDDNLSGEREFVADCVIEAPVQVILSKLLRVPSQLAQAIACGICRFERTQQSVRLLWRWLKFYLCGEFGEHSVS